MWHHFDGWCVEKNVDPLALPLPRFLDIVHRYVLLCTQDEARHAEYNARWIGPPAARRNAREVARTGLRPPAWWHGDEHATRSSLAAMAQLRRR